MEELEKTMYFGAKPAIVNKARILRDNMTYFEELLWDKLKGKQITGLRFRRQHPIDIFIADFYCVRIKLLIEVDGSIHEITEYQEHDQSRSEILNDFGITVIRFTNEQIIEEIDSTIEQIKTVAQKLLDQNK